VPDQSINVTAAGSAQISAGGSHVRQVQSTPAGPAMDSFEVVGFWSGFSRLQRELYQTAQDHGFHEVDDILEPGTEHWRARVSQMFFTMAGEVFEAGDLHQRGWAPTEIRYMDPEDLTSKPDGIPIELADVLIRLLDTAETLGIDLGQAVRVKAAYNRGRPYRHGKTF
jgi:NTP pyrophosphatase (non-canonical NTP hydrolase)